MNAPFSHPRAAEAAAPSAPTIHTAAEAAGRRIAPVWPLRTFVAVNPFLGLAGQRFEEAAETLAATAGARLTMPRAFYRAAIADGRITADDLAAALAERELPGLPRDAAALAAAANEADAAPPPPIQTVADVAGALAGKDWAGFVVDQVSAFAAEQFDEGQAAWVTPDRDGDLYRAWRRRALVDRTPEVMGLAGFRAAVARLPQDADALLVEAVRRLGLPPAGLERYFHRLLMSVGGWAAYARCRVWQAELAGGSDGALTALLAVRLAHEAVLHALFADRPGFAETWRSARARAAEPAAPSRALAVDAALQRALEKAWQRRLADRLGQPAAPAAAGRAAVQAAFCIDVRSEVFRRALESVAPEIETIGFAGFFGFPIEYVPLGQRQGGAQCPVLLTPAFTVCESVRDADAPEEAGILRLRLVRRRAGRAWKAFKLAGVSSFAFVESTGLAYLGKLVGDAFGFSRTVPHPAAEGLDPAVRSRLAPRLEPGALAGRATGMAPAARLDAAEAVLKAMSLTSGFARLVLLAGHGSTTVNNPHASGLDCGACGGHTGEANARVAAAVLNDPAVRNGLRERGIAVPDDTVFVAALHDTTTDTVRLFDTEALPAGHAADVGALQARLDAAGRLARAERAALLNLRAGRPVDPQVLARSRDWSEVRPEWGLAGCAAFIAAPRARTAGRDLGGRAFLHSYDWRQDRDFATLELIMTAPMVVASWISLQYYGSTVDNRVFGSGNKVLHNVVGTVGVLEGNGGDLRTGLPWQSLHDGERLVHEPLRLTVAIEAPREAMSAVIARHPGVRALVDNGWLHLFALNGDGRLAWRYAGDLAWQEMPAGATADAA
ncbi:DUF2309 domain-containing protein [Aquibium sp. A9E412]|uniref:YbcC family protein n=1 Tax=Aquibium sp. A9E412 TaxID=2976767 RepID=UPI0025AF7DD6|nr:DUF2309 domain-containing protein [Aquibium sp. A9E412]MDN2565544.1 DUF2309 domain-containing protein [Aquibium sp. A9E412]